MRNALIFSLAVTLQRALASELAYSALARFLTLGSHGDYIVYVVAGAAMVWAARYVRDGRLPWHFGLHLHQRARTARARAGRGTSPGPHGGGGAHLHAHVHGGVALASPPHWPENSCSDCREPARQDVRPGCPRRTASSPAGDSGRSPRLSTPCSPPPCRQPSGAGSPAAWSDGWCAAREPPAGDPESRPRGGRPHPGDYGNCLPRRRPVRHRVPARRRVQHLDRAACPQPGSSRATAPAGRRVGRWVGAGSLITERHRIPRRPGPSQTARRSRPHIPPDRWRAELGMAGRDEPRCPSHRNAPAIVHNAASPVTTPPRAVPGRVYILKWMRRLPQLTRGTGLAIADLAPTPDPGG